MPDSALNYARETILKPNKNRYYVATAQNNNNQLLIIKKTEINSAFCYSKSIIRL